MKIILVAALEVSLVMVCLCADGKAWHLRIRSWLLKNNLFNARANWINMLVWFDIFWQQSWCMQCVCTVFVQYLVNWAYCEPRTFNSANNGSTWLFDYIQSFEGQTVLTCSVHPSPSDTHAPGRLIHNSLSKVGRDVPALDKNKVNLPSSI